MKLESVAVVVLSICVFLSFYFSFLALQMVDEASKKQTVALAVSSLIASVTIFACLMIYAVIRRIFQK